MHTTVIISTYFSNKARVHNAKYMDPPQHKSVHIGSQLMFAICKILKSLHFIKLTIYI